MSSNYTALDYKRSDPKFYVQDLQTPVQSILSQGVSQISITSYIRLGTSPSTMLLRYNSTSGSLQISTDGGTSWSSITSSTINWTSGRSYSVGQCTYDDGQFYSCYTAHTASSANRPNTGSTNWRLITAGSYVYNVTNAAQLKYVLQSSTGAVCIKCTGSFAACSATINSSITSVSIQSDETMTLTGDVTFTSGSAVVVYWHSRGSNISANCTITAGTNVTIKIDRLNVTGTYTVTLSGTVYYQKINRVSGGTVAYWDSPLESSSEYVPLALETLTAGSPALTDLLFHRAATTSTNKKVTANQLLRLFQQNFGIYNNTGLLEDRPESGTYTGYTYYATDTQMYYIWLGSAWSSGYTLRGQKGDPGTSLTIGACGKFADRSGYDSQDQGFIFYSADGYGTIADWTVNTVYKQGDVCTRNSINYYCKLGHTSSSLNAPGQSQGTQYWSTTTTYNTGIFIHMHNAGTWSEIIQCGQIPGSAWYVGSGAPATSTGQVDDLYLCKETVAGGAALGNVYKKTGQTQWTLQCNIVGPQGQQGTCVMDAQGISYTFSVTTAQAYTFTFAQLGIVSALPVQLYNATGVLQNGNSAISISWTSTGLTIDMSAYTIVTAGTWTIRMLGYGANSLRCNSTAYTNGTRCYYPDKAGYMLICSTAGTSAATLPTWPTGTISSGVTTLTDGTVVWIIYDMSLINTSYSTIASLNDVDTTGLTDGSFLKYDSTSATWKVWTPTQLNNYIDARIAAYMTNNGN